MIYIFTGLEQKPKKMADGGMSLLPASSTSAFDLKPTTGGGPLYGTGQSTEGAGGFVNSMTPQSQFVAQLAPTTQLDYSPVVGSSANAVSGNIGNENNLANMFMNQATGQGGPSPEAAQLAINTGRNISGVASAMGSSRGASANPGMMTRNIGRMGAETGQQAAGQAALLEQQRRQQAYQNLMGVYNSIGSQGVNLFGSSANALAAQNANMVNNYSQAQGVNAQTAATNAQGERTMLGNAASGFANGMSSMMGMFGMSEGGEVGEDGKPVKMFDGGGLGVDMSMPSMDAPYLGSASEMPQMQDVSFGQSAPGFGGDAYQRAGDQFMSGPQSQAGQQLSGGKGGSKQDKNRQFEPDIHIQAQSFGNPYIHQMASGNVVPGKAKVSGDSESNDTVHALLSPGEIVVPRTAAQDPDKAAAFAHSVAMRHSRKGKK